MFSTITFNLLYMSVNFFNLLTAIVFAFYNQCSLACSAQQLAIQTVTIAIQTVIIAIQTVIIAVQTVILSIQTVILIKKLYFYFRNLAG